MMSVPGEGEQRAEDERTCQKSFRFKRDDHSHHRSQCSDTHIVLLFLFFFATGSHVLQASCELSQEGITVSFLILLSLPPETWDYRHPTICPVSVGLGRELGDERTLGERSTN